MSDGPSSPKRRKLSHENALTPAALLLLLEDWLGAGGTATEPPQALQSLQGIKIRQDLYALQTLLDAVGFRTSIVQSPRLAVSLYKDSCVLSAAAENTATDGNNSNNNNDGTNSDSYNNKDSNNNNTLALRRQRQDYLLTMLGLHPDQDEREAFYKSSQFRDKYCLHQFLARLRCVRRNAMKDARVQEWIQQHGQATTSSHSTPSDVKQFMKLMLQADPKLRQEQLDHELDRIGWYNCTLSNALLQQFMQGHHSCVIKDVFFKTSHVAKYERITFYLYDPAIDLVKPSSNFVFLPDLSRALQQTQQESSISKSSSSSEQQGTRAIVQDMMATFWSHLLRHGGYYASATMKEQLSPALERYFLSGLRQDPNIPLKLNAHFDPCEPISLYLWGKAGAGKSSFVRHVPPAIQAAVETHADPEILVRFVKQALNKPYKDLCLELELRPNNNDLSVMSIIQSRKCTMAQSKPGLVVVDLEEMPQYFADLEQHDPNQVQVCQLVSQRFGGRKGEYDATKEAPRNSANRGIGNDASLITLFTSNYTLEPPSREALERLPMFQHLTAVEMEAISGNDRSDFAHAYFQQSITDRIQASLPSSSIELKSMDIPLGEGDSRPLVRHLRMLAYYVSAIILADGGGLQVSNNSTPYEISVVQKGKSCQVIVGDKPALDLHVGTLDNLFPVKLQAFDPRTQQVMESLRTKTKLPEESYSELSTILDFWLGGALAPAVILSQHKSVVESLIAAIDETLKNGGVQCISNIEAGSYKMLKSLYDPRDTPNLRDDILKLGGGRRTAGGVGSSTLCAINLMCPTTDAQLCIREMVEDSPSMTAFSSDKSALYKSGLLFAVHLQGDMTPELHSRASLIL